MQVTHYQEPDLSDLEAMDLSDEEKEWVKQARIEAETVRASLVSEHVWGWLDLLVRVEAVRASTRRNAAFLGGVNLKEFDRAQNGGGRMSRFLMRLRRFCGR